MTNSKNEHRFDLTALLTRSWAEPREPSGWSSRPRYLSPQLLANTWSVLNNSASLLGKPRAYLVFGVEDGTIAVVGTAFDPLAEVAKAGGPLLPLWLHLGLQPNVGVCKIHAFSHHGGWCCSRASRV